MVLLLEPPDLRLSLLLIGSQMQRAIVKKGSSTLTDIDRCVVLYTRVPFSVPTNSMAP